MSMSDLQINYTEFHQDMDRFVSLLPNCFTQSCPHNLKHVRILPEVLMPYDSAFRDDLKLVVRKFFMIHDLLMATFQRVRRYVVPQYQEWFDNQSQKLQWFMMLVKMSIAAQKLNDLPTTQEASVMTVGIGGVNPSVKGSLMPSTLARLRDYVDGLNAAVQYQY